MSDIAKTFQAKIDGEWGGSTVDSSVREVTALVVFAVERQAGVIAEASLSRMHKRHADNLAVSAWRSVLN
jgi:hypothetical protein